MSRMGEGYGIPRHDYVGRLIVDCFGADPHRRFDDAVSAFRRWFREDDRATIDLRSMGVDPLDPSVERFWYLGDGT